MKVKNINGTSDNICKCGSWLNHWKNFSGQAIPTDCPEEKCIQRTEVGAHVQKDSFTDNSWYIIPLCKKHNGQTGQSITINYSVKLVPANVSSTCGKK